jgi:hypothetical protein
MTAAALAPEFVPGPLRPPFVHSGAGREIRQCGDHFITLSRNWPTKTKSLMQSKNKRSQPPFFLLTDLRRQAATCEVVLLVSLSITIGQSRYSSSGVV